MKQLLVFIRKEFYHVFRDRRTLLIMFGLPIVQIILFGFALSSEVKNIRMIVADYAKDFQSQRLIEKIKTSDYFVVEQANVHYKQIEDAFKKGDIKAALIIPSNFSSDQLHLGQSPVQLITDGSDPNISKTVTNYLTSIFMDFGREFNTPSINPLFLQIQPELRMLYNEEGNGSLNFIPGVMALILMIVCTALTSVSVVKEKEMGTMEILLVSPFKPVFVLIAKAIPYLLLSLANFTLILLLTAFALDVEIRGSILLLYFESTLFIVTCLSLGLLISNITNSQQTALLISLMGMMLPTLIFTGFIMPLENMPGFFQVLSHIVPSRWYYLAVKSVMLKGLGLTYVWKETLVLTLMTIILLSLALRRFKVRL
ncbi:MULTISPECIES: ABC transporter permease [Olivibacter]|uniref:ABC transporter permease n=1 Tax=Olivibacter oleidegradans TaxID=760123 RepID=A0ABV6HM50_9SPHI|nr:ABC transporter permease [Olivibacter sp. LS-1]QEL02539.1 ABC transporter permease [Olivibacter sp. LS-1]